MRETPAPCNAETMPWRSAAFICRPVVPDCQVLAVSTSSQNEYAPGLLGTVTFDCELLRPFAACASQLASWLARLKPYCHAQAGEFWPIVAAPGALDTDVV